MIINSRSRRKASGGRYKRSVEIKKKHKLARTATLTKLGDKKLQSVKGRGGTIKNRILLTDKVNVFDPKTKKYQVLEVKTIAESPANRNYIRRNIMTKGTVVETEKGKAVITSRPGQVGTLNAKFV